MYFGWYWRWCRWSNENCLVLEIEAVKIFQWNIFFEEYNLITEMYFKSIYDLQYKIKELVI